MAAARERGAILLIGLNPDSTHELRGLRATGSRVLFVGNAKTADVIMVGGRPFNLTSAEGRQALFSTIKLSDYQRSIVDPVLADAYRNSRDELGQLTMIWASTERGLVMPNRLVLSAHHAGTSEFWGHSNGIITFDQIKKLVTAFPKARDAIQHIHFSACYSASRMMSWTTVFPNVLTIWAYGGSAPGSYTGAEAHLRIWERATRTDGAQLHRSSAGKTRKGTNVTIWSRKYGLETEVEESIETLRAREASDRHVFQEFFDGLQNVVDTDNGPLRDYYNDVQALLNHSALEASERPALEKRRETTIRLLFYQKDIRAKFQQNYSSTLKAGYAALKLEIPNFALLDRRQALAAVVEFQKMLGKTPPSAAKQCLDLLTLGLPDLDPRYIPANWIRRWTFCYLPASSR
jgi:hypothetical protein